MNIFTKAKLVKLLNDKVQSGEIKGFHLGESYLRIQKSKRTGFTFKFNEFGENILLNILKRITPHPSVQNIENFYQKEIKRYKL